MKTFNVAILGCGTVGGGVAQILLNMKNDLALRTGRPVNLTKIVELFPSAAAKKYAIPRSLFCGGANDLSLEEAQKYIQEILSDDTIDLVVETIGGSSDFILNTAVAVCNSKKHFVTANKKLLAEKGTRIFEAAMKNKVVVGFEASVCGAIPVIKVVQECFTGDEILSVSGIMNGTSNYILSMMQNENLDFVTALKMAQEKGYAEADPTLDINGYDAAHKLIILIKLAFGIAIAIDKLHIIGIEKISKEDIDFAREIDASIKLICFAKKSEGKIFATVQPMMVKKGNILAGIHGATNAVRFENTYSGSHVLIGKGAGSTETASSIVADIVFIARYAEKMQHTETTSTLQPVNATHVVLPYIVTFETDDVPGITGLVTTAIGNSNINIDTVSHNRHDKDKAVFSVATMPCTLKQIHDAIAEIQKKNPGVLINAPKIIPILY